MARNTQTVEIDLKSGITTNDSRYSIGSRLAVSANSSFGFRYPRLTSTSDNLTRSHRMPLAFPDQAGAAFTGAKSMRDIGFIANGFFSNFAVAIGCNASDQYAYWATSGGAELKFRTGTTRTTVSSGSKLLGCSTYWANPGNDPSGGATSDGVMVFSHQSATHVYYLLDSADSTDVASGARSLTSLVTNCPAGAAALTTHLDRLWLLTAGDGARAKLWYTDPLNLTSIRTTNVIQIPGRGQCLIPAHFGGVDNSVTPRLIIGCSNSVLVLDGDPQLGGGLQADLRTIISGVGIQSSQAAALTPFGVFFLGTDGDLWLIAPGAPSASAVGGPILNALGRNHVSGALETGGDATGAIAWLSPYLYIFPGGEKSVFYTAEPSTDGLKFWGPHTCSNAAGAGVAVVRSPQDWLAISAPSGLSVTSLHSLTMLPVSAVHRFSSMDQFTATTGAYPGGSNLERTAEVRTGLINVPGHKVSVSRVILDTAKIPQVASVDVVWYVRLYDEAGNSVNGVRVPDPAVPVGTNLDSVVYTQHFVFPPLVASRGVSIDVFCTTAADLSLQRLLVEIHTTPAQF